MESYQISKIFHERALTLKRRTREIKCAALEVGLEDRHYLMSTNCCPIDDVLDSSISEDRKEQYEADRADVKKRVTDFRPELKCEVFHETNLTSNP